MPQQRPLIGFVLSHEQFSVPELLEYGKAAEDAGFDMVWTSDHFQPRQDNQGHAGFAWATLAALSQRVSRIAMGTGVTCPSMRYHPAIVAQAFATLGALAPGRVFLGVGAGEAVNEAASGNGWGDYAERSARLGEAVELIRALWSGDWTAFAGTYYSIENAKLYDVPTSKIPIYVAASGSKSMYQAGLHGDGLITDAVRALRPELRRAFEQGARDGEKDPAKMPVLAETMVVVGDEAEAQRTAELWRYMPKSWECYVAEPDPVSIEEQAKRDIPLDQVYAQWPVSTDPRVHIQTLKELFDGGVTHAFIHSPQADQRRVIEFYGRMVLPRLRAHPEQFTDFAEQSTAAHA